MEMPIQIFITLFVLIVVGSLVVMFSQDLLGESSGNIKKFSKGGDEPAGAQFLEVDSVSAPQMANLVEECYRQNYGKSLSDQRCYVVHSQTENALTRQDVGAALGNADILGEVDESLARTFFISWDFGEAKVVVAT